MFLRNASQERDWGVANITHRSLTWTQVCEPVYSKGGNSLIGWEWMGAVMFMCNSCAFHGDLAFQNGLTIIGQLSQLRASPVEVIK